MFEREEVAILKLDKIDFKPKMVTRDKKNFIIQRGISSERYNRGKYIGPNIQSHKHIKQMLTDMKGETDNNIIIIGTSIF